MVRNRIGSWQTTYLIRLERRFPTSDDHGDERVQGQSKTSEPLKRLPARSVARGLLQATLAIDNSAALDTCQYICSNES
jgi:hypothetical protein